MASFGELLAQYMTRTGVSDSELARHLGVSRQTIFRWKEGLTSRPRVREDVVKCAEKLRLSHAERTSLLLAAGFAPDQEPTAGTIEPSFPTEYGTVAAPFQAAAPFPSAPPPATAPVLLAAPLPNRRRPAILLALGAVALLVIVVASVTLLLQSQNGKNNAITPIPPSTNPRERLIVLGRLTRVGGDAPNYDVTARLRDGIEREADAARLTTRLVLSPNPIADDATAAAVQAREGASILLWGTYQGSRVQAHLLGATANAATTALPLPQTITFDSASSNDVRALGLAVVVQLLWDGGDPIQARAFLLQARGLPNLSPELTATLNAWDHASR